MPSLFIRVHIDPELGPETYIISYICMLMWINLVSLISGAIFATTRATSEGWLYRGQWTSPFFEAIKGIADLREENM